MPQNRKIPDEPHLRHIRSLLWADREYGRAAIMVGAGFSRNAVPIRASSPPIPLWSELAAVMEARVLGVRVEDLPRGSQRVGPLRAASDFEHVFRRPALDDLLRNTLADASFIPSDLHESLLSLPWSDVFTTNYDTLLERACTRVVGRKYDVVVSPDDIPGAMKPRIVKLHGSFPSHGPFIITEEDYRTYPSRFAPFVNMVQQSIMENALCLVGFSGDDPNFLEWTGWVRDNLGANAPTVYLVGAFDLPPWKRQVFAKRGVTVVDIGSLFPTDEWPQTAERHREALRWFLQSLLNGAPPDPMEWPNEGWPQVPPADTRIPASIPPDLVASPPSMLLHPFEALKPGELEALRKSWEIQRRRYPGWLTCPPETRKRLWRETRDELRAVADQAGGLPPAQALALLFELVWRLERIEAPAYDPLPAAVEAVLRRVDPYPSTLQIDGALRPGEDAGATLDWDLLGRQWLDLALFALKAARRSGDGPAFDRLAAQLDGLARSSPALRAHLSWERCLHYFGTFGAGKLDEELNSWTPTPDLPLWELRRGSLLGELGEVKEATDVLTQALATIRARLGAGATDRELLSLEGWTMAALRAVSVTLTTQRGELRKYTRRWAQLERYGASPWDDIESMRDTIKHAPPSNAVVELRKTFDPGSFTSTHHFSNDDQDLVAFQALALLERGGGPLRVGFDKTFGSLAEAAAAVLLDAEPAWAVTTLVRSESSEPLQAAFSRPRVVRLAPKDASRLIRSALDGLSEALTKPQKSRPGRSQRASLSWRLVGTLGELLSRLTLRMSAAERSETLELAIRMYGSSDVRQERSTWATLQNLLRRTLDALTDEELAQALTQLLALPVQGEPGLDKGPEPAELWPEPFARLHSRDKCVVEVPVSRVRALVSLVETGNSEARSRSAMRLVWLHDAGLLGQSTAAFVEALWSQTEPSTGLPVNIPFWPDALLDLPAPTTHEPRSLLRSHALSVPFPPLTSPIVRPDGTSGRAMGFPNRAETHFDSLLRMTTRPWLLQAPPRFDWTSEEAKALLTKSLVWWSAEESYIATFKGRPSTDRGDLDGILTSFVAVLGRVIAPFLDPSAREDALQLLDRLQSRGIPVLSARVVFRRDETPAIGDELADQIRGGLLSDHEAIVDDALEAIALWFFFGKGTFPEDLLDVALIRILARRQPGARHVLSLALAVALQRPEAWRGRRATLIEAALDNLLSDTAVTLPESNASGPASIALEERPDFRALAAELAGILSGQEQKAGIPLSPTLRRWEVVGQDDPLHEVRRAWRRGYAAAFAKE